MLLFSCQVVSDNTLQPHGLQHTRLLCHSLSPEVCSGSCMPYCSYSIGFYFHHQRHPSMIEHRFRFGLTASFFLELLVIALCSSPVAYWTPSDLRGSSSGVISFCIFILFMGFFRQENLSELSFTPPVDHSLSELVTMTPLGWPCMAWLITSLSYTSPFAMTRL